MWAPWQQFLINKIEQTQHRATRYVTSDYNPFSSVSLHISNLKWDTLEDRRNKSRLCSYVLQNDPQPSSNPISFIHPTLKLSIFTPLKYNEIFANVMQQEFL